jgi:hypothetical protein
MGTQNQRFACSLFGTRNDADTACFKVSYNGGVMDQRTQRTYTTWLLVCRSANHLESAPYAIARPCLSGDTNLRNRQLTHKSHS